MPILPTKSCWTNVGRKTSQTTSTIDTGWRSTPRARQSTCTLTSSSKIRLGLSNFNKYWSLLIVTCMSYKMPFNSLSFVFRFNFLLYKCMFFCFIRSVTKPATSCSSARTPSRFWSPSTDWRVRSSSEFPEAKPSVRISSSTIQFRRKNVETSFCRSSRKLQFRWEWIGVLMFLLAFYNQYFKKINHLLLTSGKSALIIKFNTKTILKIDFVTCNPWNVMTLEFRW